MNLIFLDKTCVPTFLSRGRVGFIELDSYLVITIIKISSRALRWAHPQLSTFTRLVDMDRLGFALSVAWLVAMTTRLPCEVVRI